MTPSSDKTKIIASIVKTYREYDSRVDEYEPL